MSLGADQVRRLIDTLAAEPGLASLADARTPTMLWGDGDAPVWTSVAGRRLLERLPTSLDGVHRLPASTASRLRALLQEKLAPANAFRLERLRWGRMEAPVTLACRRVTGEGADLLLTAILPPARPSRPTADVAAATRETAQPGETDHAPVAGPRAAPGRRFTWHADADGHFTFVSPQLSAVVGERGAEIVGRRWDELSGRVVSDESGAVGRAWMAGLPWSRIVVGWRDPDRERLVPVEFSGAPVAGPPSASAAYRGFGIAFPEQSRVIVPGAFADLSSPSAKPEDATTMSETLGEAVGTAAALGEKTGEAVFSMFKAWLAPMEKVGEGPVPHDPSEPANALTTNERGALHEIARTLRGTPEPDEKTTDRRPSAEIVTLARPRPRPEGTALLDGIPAGIVVSREGTVLYANRFLLARLGFPDLPGAVAKGALQGLTKLSSEDAAPGAVSLPDAGGETHLFEVRAARVEWKDLGADLMLLTPPAAAPAAVIDALRLDLDGRDRRHEDMRAALDLASDGIVTLDRKARLIGMTRSAEILFGVTANEVVGDSITALLDPQGHRAVLACLEALESEPMLAVKHCEVTRRSRGGTSTPLALRAGRAPGAEGGFLVAFTDVTSQRMLEDDLREARASAEAASAARAEFLARISHEIRTPLTAITGFAELMLEERFGPLGSERYKGYARDVRDSGVHVLSLVNDLLDLAKATSGTDILEATSVDLNAVVRNCVALAAPMAAQEKTIVRTSFPANLPRVFADERSVRQIVINLLSNAIRFTGAGGQVIVSTALGGHGDVVLSVRDTGPGMSEEEVATALTPFRQVPTTRRGDGTGLGLPLSKALTEANGGVFRLTSIREQGTLVEVLLPIEEAGAVAAE